MPRNRLSSAAKRSGWQGSKILLGQLSEDARVDVVSKGASRDPSEARDRCVESICLHAELTDRIAWRLDVRTSCYACPTALCTNGMSVYDFTLQEFNQRFLGELKLRYPRTRNVEAKIRQQLQVLRDGGGCSRS